MNRQTGFTCLWNAVTAASRACLLGVLILTVAALDLAAAHAAGERGRVRVQNGTVVSDRNTILRGATMAVMYGPGNSNNSSYWHHMNVNLGLNAVRLGVKTGQIGRSVEQQLAAIDNAVNSAARQNMYVMINNSIRPGSYDLAELQAFWSVVAPRYKDRTHVLYEMTNEPVNGGPHWGNVVQYNEKVLADLKVVYDIMRRGAPDTHIALFTAPNLYPDCNSYAAMIGRMPGVDWQKTSVGFHHYQGTQKFGAAGLNCLRNRYPLLMTETNYWTTREVGNLRDALNLYEQLQISWFSLDGKGSTYRLQNEILPALRRAGHSWEAER